MLQNHPLYNIQQSHDGLQLKSLPKSDLQTLMSQELNF